jgi:ATP/maltotriose-dependent transcriptional regulator MalT
VKEHHPPHHYPRRIIERPRLLKQLEETSARTILLVAPAGYGKTTLARQWLEHAEGASLPIRHAESDVVVLARALARRLARDAPGLLKSIDEGIRVSPTPRQQARTALRAIFAEIKGSSDIWLVIDDYHELKAGSPSRVLIDTLEASGRFRFLIASRTRPKWASARRQLYGELLELDEHDLAFDQYETSELLGGRKDATRLHGETRGWPALLSLAAMRREHDSTTPSDLRTLYEFFAEEIFAAAPKRHQAWMVRLATLPPSPAAVLDVVLGEDGATDAVVRIGIAYNEDGAIVLHPLVRNFLLTKLDERPDALRLLRASIQFALTQECWDEAFQLIKRFQLNDFLDDLVATSYLKLVEEGRVETVATFADYATSRGGLSQALLDLIGGEIAFREGELRRARTLAIGAAAQLPENHSLKATCYLIAGRAAQLSWSHAEALHDFKAAQMLAQRRRDRNDALWGRFLNTQFLEDERMRELLRALERIKEPTVEDRLRLVQGRQNLGRLITGLSDAEHDMRIGNTLLPSIRDPLVRTGWANSCGYMLLLQCKYAEAVEVLKGALADVDKYGLEFARPHLECSLAAARLGLRQFARSDALLRRVERHVLAGHSAHLHLNTCALRARLFLSQRRVADAVASTSVDFSDAPRNAMYGEYMATRALSLALAGQCQDALQAASDAVSATRAVETQVIGAAAIAIALTGSSESRRATDELISVADRLRTWDGVVCAVRASPALLATLAASRHRPVITGLLARSNDSSLARAARLTDRRPDGRGGILTRREAEVVDLLGQGLRTREIATALYIANSTVKVHVRNIFRKLDAHTRAEAVARYRDTSLGTGDSSDTFGPRFPSA